jgi:glycosyltransferase involved in cell wall biosynthesis
MAFPAKRLSIIISTRNRAYAITGCLDAVAKSLARIAPETAEIVVVDNGSEDATSAAVTRWGETSVFPVRLVFEPKKGKCAALNTGIRSSCGRLLVFTDDDCRPDENYLVDALRHDDADSELTLRGGRVELGDPTDLPLTIKTDRTRQQWRKQADTSARFSLLECFPGCNMAMRRVLFDRIGFFDERFGPGSRYPACEDKDLIFRAYLAGILIEYVPDMVVHHHHGRKTVEDARKLLHSYNVGGGALYAKIFFTDTNSVRPFWWNIQRAVLEIFGGRPMVPALNISYRSTVVSTLQGMFTYWADAIFSRGRP